VPENELLHGNVVIRDSHHQQALRIVLPHL